MIPCAQANNLFSRSPQFTSKERDSESGLDYFGARYYGSALGRFSSPDDFNDSGITDPFTGKVIFSPGPLPYADIGNPQSLNKYAYVLNNPLRYTDPNGHCVEDACILEGAAVGTGVLYGGAAIAGALGFTAAAKILHDNGDAIVAGAKSIVGSIGSLITQASNSNSNQNAPPPPTQTTQGDTSAPPTTATAQPKANPMQGTPGSTSTTTHADGQPKQTRAYGDDGYPKTDVDCGHDHGQGDPHAHDWGRPTGGNPPTHVDRGPGRPVRPGDTQP